MPKFIASMHHASTTVQQSCDHNDDSSDSDVALSADALQYEDIQPVVGCRCAAAVESTVMLVTC